MKNGLTYFAMFATGAAIGSVVTWRYLKDKYAKIAQEEIDSMKEILRERQNEVDEDDENSYFEYEDGADEERKNAYEKYSSMYTDAVEQIEKENETNMGKKPYVISPEEFDELEEYDKVSLTYYSGDNVLADSFSDEVFEEDEIDEAVGSDFASHFGEYEDDSVFVRNESRYIDYEILMDERSYQEAVGKKHSRVAYQDFE